MMSFLKKSIFVLIIISLNLWSASPEVESLFELLQKQIDAGRINEKIVFDQFNHLEEKKLLEPTILGLIKKAVDFKLIPAHLESHTDVLTVQLYQLIRSELYARGYTSSFIFPSWSEVSNNLIQEVESLPSTNNFNDQFFYQAFLQVSGQQFSKPSSFEILNDPKDALARRISLISNAQKEINLMSWGFHDDETGKQVANTLIQAKQRGVVVRIIVDNQVSWRPGYHKELRRLEKNGVNVVYWKGIENPYFGMHAKILIVDNFHVIEGGRNIGDYYLMENKWSDVDIYYTGISSSIASYNFFAMLFNEQLTSQKLKMSQMKIIRTILDDKGWLATVYHYPNQSGYDPIYLLTLYMIQNAKKEIDIANAYLILTPAIKEYLVSAIERGVRVRVYTNSTESIDEPIINQPIMESVRYLKEKGAGIYLKKGQTLHTKMFRSDSLLWVGTYNLHPRSLRYEVEKVTFINNKAQVKKMSDNFNYEISIAQKVLDVSELPEIEKNIISLLLSLFFNQL